MENGPIVEDAKVKNEAWRIDDNEHRPQNPEPLCATS
jgi:hypothetical protein